MYLRLTSMAGLSAPPLQPLVSDSSGSLGDDSLESRSALTEGVENSNLHSYIHVKQQSETKLTNKQTNKQTQGLAHLTTTSNTHYYLFQ